MVVGGGPTGSEAWLMGTVLCIWEVIGFRNRFSVIHDWIYSFFAHDRSARLIFEAELGSTPASEPIPFRS